MVNKRQCYVNLQRGIFLKVRRAFLIPFAQQVEGCGDAFPTYVHGKRKQILLGSRVRLCLWVKVWFVGLWASPQETRTKRNFLSELCRHCLNRQSCVHVLYCCFQCRINISVKTAGRDSPTESVLMCERQGSSTCAHVTFSRNTMCRNRRV